MQARSSVHHPFSGILSWLYRAFDAVATWVTQLSWWKFFLFAALLLIAGAILQEELFSDGEAEIAAAERAARREQASILIDDSGIHFNPRNKPRAGAPETTPTPPVPPATPPAPAAGTGGSTTAPDLALPKGAHPNGDAVHIELPPQIAEELSVAIEGAVDDAAEAKVSRYHKQASTWFTSFVWLLVLALFGTKALVGGKKRAEQQTLSANAAAERESMQRQLSEARMQMMQAQVEPHFLFNTLASVEHLIETNPPRASAMQRSLIQYLRAVLPQMRENNLVTNLGREVDMVTAYLNLLKMRMEERLTVDMRIPEKLRTASFPPMMLQSMVENAIKHGLECKPEGGTLKIVADVADGKLRVTVTDDGVGFGVVPSTGTGLGLPTIRERLRLLHGDAGQLHIAANSPSGVIAMVEVPYQVSR
ncbi:histidine kinase [Massilia sp. Dwa41.01b]|uniref:sensor histidine kinase n=1 Tax=unclassified Massilia TaxID=2609279 RepID=UPI0015FF2EDF|nr:MULTISPECIES: histidine kinase [unclassified Massilia]QNA88483.1 histidine kinase [Massilia sp. Dwa41.01b]QNA99377.1 histidine kinase [Massilia sp. Se16.2.3]